MTENGEVEIVDVVKELNASYVKAIANDFYGLSSEEFFKKRVKELFDKYHERMKYRDDKAGESLFLHNINFFKNSNPKKRKRTRRIQQVKENFFGMKTSIRSFWDGVGLKSFYHPREGDGEIYTDWQIRNLDLNPNSYY